MAVKSTALTEITEDQHRIMVEILSGAAVINDFNRRQYVKHYPNMTKVMKDILVNVPCQKVISGKRKKSKLFAKAELRRLLV